MSSEPRYTIEQVELLRRLVRTGLTKEEIIHAVDTMTRLDRDLGPVSPPAQHPQHSIDSRVSSIQSPVQPQPSPQSSVMYDLSHMSDNTAYSDVDTTTFQIPHTAQTTFPIITSVGRHQDIINPPKVSDGDYLISRGIGPFKAEEFDAAPEEIQTLMSRGDASLRDEIKEFLRKNNISQNQLGREIGVTGSYISQYFHSVRSMRNSTITLMCKWYISKKKEMDGLLATPSISVPQPSRSMPSLIQTRPATTSRYSPYSNSRHDSTDKNYKVRKERFVWKDNCTKILEVYFKKNLYPNDSERIRLSEACNAVQQVTDGQPESGHQIVTPERVYHWFANRRKELNKRKRHSSDVRQQESDVEEITLTDLVDTTESCEDHTTPNTKQAEVDSDDDQPSDPKEIANQLQEVNNSILTFMKAVEEKTEQEVEQKAAAQRATE